MLHRATEGIGLLLAAAAEGKLEKSALRTCHISLPALVPGSFGAGEVNPNAQA